MTLNLPLCRQLASEHPYPLLFAVISGAHDYGFAFPGSDCVLHRGTAANRIDFARG